MKINKNAARTFSALFTFFILLLFAQAINAQVAVAPLQMTRMQVLNATGEPLAAGCMTFNAAGTSTPQAIYADNSGSTQLPNPLTLDAAGEASIWLTNTSYDITAYTGVQGQPCSSSLGSSLWTEKNKNIYAILNQAQNLFLTCLPSDPIGIQGEFSCRNDLGKIRFFFSTWDSVVTEAGAATLTNKTLMGAVLTNPAVNGVTPDSVVPIAGQVYSATSPSAAGFRSRTIGIPFIIDGSGTAITTGTKGYVEIPFACTIVGWTILADQSGSAVIDVLSGGYPGFPSTSSLAGSDRPTLAAQQKNQNLALTQWITNIAAGQIFEFKVISASTVTRLTVSLRATIP